MFCKLLVVAIILPLAWAFPSELVQAEETFKDTPPLVEDMNLIKRPNPNAIEASLNEDIEETDGDALKSTESMEDEEDIEAETLKEQTEDTIVTTNEVTDSITQDDTTLPNVEVMSSTDKPIWTPNPEVVEGMKTFFKKAAEEFDHKPIEVVEGIKDAFKKAVEGVIKFLNLS